MSTIELNFSSPLLNRNQALLGIGTEISTAFNAVRAGFGDEFLSKAQDQFPSTPISFGIDVSQYSNKSGTAYFTLVWGQLTEGGINPYGYFLDFLMDLSATTITVNQFKQAVRNRWTSMPTTQRILNAYKRAKRVEAGNPDDVTEIDVVAIGDVCWHDIIEARKHKFARRPDPIPITE